MMLAFTIHSAIHQSNQSNQSINQSTSTSTNHSINQAINQATNQPNQPNQPINQLMIPSVNVVDLPIVLLGSVPTSGASPFLGSPQ